MGDYFEVIANSNFHENEQVDWIAFFPKLEKDTIAISFLRGLVTDFLQIFLNYGPFTNRKLFAEYDMVIPNNPYDSLVISVPSLSDDRNPLQYELVKVVFFCDPVANF